MSLLEQWSKDFQQFINWHERNIRAIRGRYFISPQTRVAVSSMLTGLTASLTSVLASSNIKNSDLLVNQFKALIFFSSRLGPAIPEPKFFNQLVLWFNRNILPIAVQR